MPTCVGNWLLFNDMEVDLAGQRVRGGLYDGRCVWIWEWMSGLIINDLKLDYYLRQVSINRWYSAYCNAKSYAVDSGKSFKK